MKKTIMIIVVTAMITGVISIYGAYAATTYAISANKIGYSDNANLGVTDVQAAIDGTCTKFSSQLSSLKENIVDTMYPVGSIYTSETDSTVASVQNRFKAFGKKTTWVVYSQGKVLVGSGTGTDSNGTTQTFSVSNNSKNLGEYTHKLTISEMPSHNHSTKYMLLYTDNSAAVYENAVANGVNNRSGWVTGDGIFSNTGGDGKHNNVQPYTAVYMYKRTS